MTINNALNRVNKLPTWFLRKPPKIMASPANISERATKLARLGEKLKCSISVCGGNGNLLEQWIINAIQRLRRMPQGAKQLSLRSRLSIALSKAFMISPDVYVK